MRTVLLFVAALFCASWLTASCSTTRFNSLQGIDMPRSMEFEPLSREQYEVLADTEGQGCSEFYALWPLPIFWTKGENASGALYGFPSFDSARNIAVYHAIEKVPRADGLMSPRYWATVQREGVWHSIRCVTVKAKAFSIKPDQRIEETIERRPPDIDLSVPSDPDSYDF